MTASASPARATSADPRFEELVEELSNRLQAGEEVDIEAFARAHPDHAERLRQVLPALRVLVELGGSGERAKAAAAAPEAGDLPGTLGDFRIVREVGRGGMGVVYEAVQLSLDRRVALKVLPFAATMDPRQLQRFHNEARAAASLHHEHIVPVYAVGSERGVHFFAMQFVDGQSLAELIADLRQPAEPATPTGAGQPTTPYAPADGAARTAAVAAAATERAPRDAAYCRRVAEWGIQAAEALEHAHALGIVHRDVKPGNLLVDAQGRLCVTDFGLARSAADTGLTMTGDVLGTLRYMSPEQALAKHNLVDHRTDVYGLGATLYELLTLQPAVGGRDRQEILQQVAAGEPVPPRKLNPSVPADLETVVLKAMARGPAERYATAQELADDLRRWLSDQPIQARRPTLPQRARKWARRHKALVRAATALVLVVLLLGGGFLWREQQQRAAVERAVEASLERVELFQQQERWDEALAILEAAEGQLEGHRLEVLRQRVQRQKRDVEMLTRLENARLRLAAAGKERVFDYVGADRLYAEAFQWYGLDVVGLTPEEAAEHIRASAISGRLIAALDDWAYVKGMLQKGGGASLRTVADLADDDPWRRRLRGVAGRGDQAALEKLAEEERTRGQPAVNLVLLARALRNTGSRRAAERLLWRAQQERPADFWINFHLAYTLRQDKKAPDLAVAVGFYRAALALRPQSPAVHLNLGNALKDQGHLDDAIAAYQEAIRLKKDYPEAHYGLGNALLDKGRLDEAIAAYREAIRFKKDFTKAHNNLGIALKDKGQLDEAIAAWREAIRLKPDLAELKPDLAEAHNNLGNALAAKGRFDEAIAAWREAIRLKKDYPEAHYNLGVALAAKGRLDDAVAAYRQALRLKKDFPRAHVDLGIALAKKGRLDEAIAQFRGAIRLKKDYSEAHYNLGVALRRQGKLKEAEAAFRETIRLRPEDPQAHCELGGVLEDQGQFAEALRLRRRGHELGSKDPRWPHPSAQWVKRCERLVELDAKLPKVLKGEVQPTNGGECLTLAGICQRHKSLYAAASRFYAVAFAEQPKLADDLNAEPRYSAACAAALAGCGQGKDADQSDARERTRLRRQALDWLRADLAAYRRLLDKEPDKVRATVGDRMQHWLQDKDFSGVRGEALDKLPEAEHKEWQRLWQEVEALRQRATSPQKAAKPGGP
jgi:tetratricopeptide (TPR) repeat protein